MNPDRPPTIDPTAAARWLALPRRSSAWLHEEVARRMLERLIWIRCAPRHVLHWEASLGGLQADAALQQLYPQANLFRVEQGRLVPPAARVSEKPWWHPARWSAGQGGASYALPESGVDMLWANMLLHMSADPAGLMRQWQQALSVDGILMFSCLGPDTLNELRAIYREQGWPTPSHDFTDMHDWGDMLLQAGFAEPVLDMERIELTFASPQRLLQELRELGRNLQPGRFAGLRGRRWQQNLSDALMVLAMPGAQGSLKLTFEVIYGHALKPRPRHALAGQTVISLDDMRQSLRRQRDD